MSHYRWGLVILVGLLGAPAWAADEAEPTGKLQDRKFEKEIKVTVKLDYLLFLPEGYGKGDKQWPLVLFLHGLGDQISRLKRNGLPAQIERNAKDYPFILVTPQNPQRGGWDVANLNSLLDDVTAKYKVDKDRIYVTGLSMGGFGSWAMAAAYPDKFAAIVPICGGGNPADARKIKHLPVWAFHGAKDDVVPVARTEAMVKALKDAGSDRVKVTIYPDARHDSWTATYRDAEMWKWLLEQKRGSGK